MGRLIRVELSHEAVRQWEAKLAPVPAGELRRRRHGKGGARSRHWHVDETSHEGRAVVSSVFLSSAGRHRPIPFRVGVSAEVELRAARAALANLVSGGAAARATIPSSGRRSSEANGATLPYRHCQAAHVSSRSPLPRSHRAGPAPRFRPDLVRLPVCRRRVCLPIFGASSASLGQAAGFSSFSSTPCGTAPSRRYLQSATKSLRASATIMTLRSRPRAPPRRSWNQRERAQPGW